MADDTGTPNAILIDSVGSSPEVSENLKVKNRVINSANQAFSVCQSMINDWKKGILNAARITAKLNGERPYNQKKLKDAGKDYKTNISTGFLSTECSKVLPRLYMPIKTAKYLTAASLPSGYPDGDIKTDYFRQTITEAIRAWPKFNFYIRGMAREVGIFGFAFNAWFDEYEWRPTLLRMDKGFVPQGTEVMDTEPQFFLAKYDYSPSELLELLKGNVDSGRDEWKKQNVVSALNGASPPPVDSTYPEARTYEDLIRQATWGYRYTKGYKVIRTWHLFSKETTGKISHYVLLADGYGGTAEGPSAVQADGQGDDDFNSGRVLFEYLDQFDSMQDCMNSMAFDFGDGTIHGVWGAGQILYDLAAQVEKVRCDSIDNLRMTNKMKIQVPEAKNVNDVKLSVNDTMMIVSGGTFAGNTAGITQDVEGYEELDMKLTQIAQQKIGAFVPPIPSQPSDIKAAQINAALAKEHELQEALLENWLVQVAVWISTITRRLCRKGSPDDVAKELRDKLLEKLSEDEIDLLVNSKTTKSIMDFTEFQTQKRAAFAQGAINNPLYRQDVVARTIAAAAGDERFVEAICVPNGDQSAILEATRQQLTENAALAIGQPVPVIPKDNDWAHMQAMKPSMTQIVQASPTDPRVVTVLQLSLQHYAAHYQQGVAKKQIPEDQINSEKSWIATMEKGVQALQQQAQIRQQQAAAGVPPGPTIDPEAQPGAIQ